jgi:hypothetical protein
MGWKLHFIEVMEETVNMCNYEEHAVIAINNWFMRNKVVSYLILFMSFLLISYVCSYHFSYQLQVYFYRA